MVTRNIKIQNHWRLQRGIRISSRSRKHAGPTHRQSYGKTGSLPELSRYKVVLENLSDATMLISREHILCSPQQLGNYFGPVSDRYLRGDSGRRRNGRDESFLCQKIAASRPLKRRVLPRRESDRLYNLSDSSKKNETKLGETLREFDVRNQRSVNDNYLNRQAELFQNAKHELLKDYEGKYVLFEDDVVLDSGSTRAEVAARAYADGGMRVLFIEKVSLVSYPTPSVWTPFSRFE
jgi:hypothetical protein